jgi:4'-phosphopantetheinyl transferase
VKGLATSVALAAEWGELHAWPRLEAGQVHVWRADLALDQACQAQVYESLTDAERRGAARRRSAQDRQHAVASRGILRHLLGRYLEQSPSSIALALGPYGKLRLAGEPADLRFNLAHSGGLAALAFALGREVGVDLQERVPIDLGELESSGFLSGGEVRELQRLNGQQRDQAVLRCWTRKEALLKAMGVGMLAPLSEIEVGVKPGRPVVLHLPGGQAQLGRWSMTDLDLDASFAASLVFEGEAAVSVRTWEPALSLCRGWDSDP